MDHILLINIHHGNIASGESFRTVILQRGESGGRFERALVSHWYKLEGGNQHSMNVMYNI